MPISRDDILDELWPLWNEIAGLNRESAANMSIVQCLKDGNAWDDFDPADLEMGVVEQFGVQIPEDEWREFWGDGVEPDVWEEKVEPMITFGRLADLIIAHFPDVSFRPVEICGRTCGPAGAFFGLQELAAYNVENVRRFAPSSRVKNHLKQNRLVQFWSQLRILTRNAVPPLTDPVGNCAARMGILSLGLGLCLLLMTCVHAVVEVPWRVFYVTALSFGSTLFLTIVLAALRLIAGSRMLRLPTGIQTFRDLAERISTAESY
jgi:hypothetical protein